MEKKKRLIVSILGVLSIVLITGGVTYAFFNYAKTGTTDNVITTDTITFLYTEVDGVGNGISIQNAFPISDEKGKALTKTNEYFDFKVTSKTASTISIPYEVTARKSKDSDDIDEYIRVYLTKGETNEEVLLENYDQLDQTDKVDVSKYTEKIIYTDTVPANESNYEESFRLKMWIDEDARFDSVDMNNKTFTLTVNVYANANTKIEVEEDDGILFEWNRDTPILDNIGVLYKVSNTPLTYEQLLNSYVVGTFEDGSTEQMQLTENQLQVVEDGMISIMDGFVSVTKDTTIEDGTEISVTKGMWIELVSQANNIVNLKIVKEN